MPEPSWNIHEDFCYHGLSMPWDLNGHLDVEYCTKTGSIAGNILVYRQAIGKYQTPNHLTASRHVWYWNPRQDGCMLVLFTGKTESFRFATFNYQSTEA